ncbi:hypothetical protein M758_8G107700 [Ceratodon purpureus]|nr:hypothetical protein M758_8G107700 [Ceratodon purpureus]
MDQGHFVFGTVSEALDMMKLLDDAARRQREVSSAEVVVDVLEKKENPDPRPDQETADAGVVEEKEEDKEDKEEDDDEEEKEDKEEEEDDNDGEEVVKEEIREGELAAAAEVQPRGSWARDSDAEARKRVMKAPLKLPKKTRPQSTHTEPALPSPPPPPSVYKYGATGALVTWAPAKRENRISRMTAFEVEIRQHGGTMGWTTMYVGTGKAYTVAGLPSGMDYGVRVRAFNQAGISRWCKEVKFSTPPVHTESPPAPSRQRRSTVTNAWSPPPPTPTPTPPERPIVVTPPTRSTFVASPPTAPKPPAFKKVTPTSVRIQWSSPASENVLSYRLLVDDGHGGRLRRMYEGPTTWYKASDLKSGLKYRAAIQATNAFGTSAKSEIAEVELPAMASQKPLTVVKEIVKCETTGRVQGFLTGIQQIQQLHTPQALKWTSIAGICAAIVAASIVLSFY